jgi:CheY-like chemotaxis protein
MRTPLNAIIGMTTIAKKADTAERKDYCLSRIDSASNHLLGVINDILDMSKIEAGKLELSPAVFDVEKTIRRAVEINTFRIDEKHQVFNFDFDADIPRFLIGDDQRLVQVITNLLSNAVKFTPEGGRVSLSAFYEGEAEAQSGESSEKKYCVIRMEVADSGIGISLEQQAKLFNSFQQADGNTTRKYGGTGLGLAISKRIVELMGGRIWIESEAGKGSAFIFTVKAEVVPEDEHEIEDDGEEGEEVEAPDFSRFRALCAEDVDINREITGVLLEPTGMKIDFAANGGEAVEKYAASPEEYDIILMDVQMPDIDGYEATRRIRKIEAEKKLKRVPIIAMSANVFREDVERCLAAGMDDHTGKPLNIGELLAKLKKLLPS